MATNAQNIDLTMQRLGSRSSPTLRAWVIQEMNKAIRELERGPTKPWFMEGRLEGTLTANQDYLTIPATFLEEVEEGSFRILDSRCNKWKALIKLDYDQLQHKSENCDPALPCYYALRGNRVYFGATPDLAYAYRWEATVRTTPVADNTSESTNEWLVEFFDLVSLITADKVLRLHIKSFDIADSLAGLLNQARDDFWRACEARQQKNRDYEQE